MRYRDPYEDFLFNPAYEPECVEMMLRALVRQVVIPRSYRLEFAAIASAIGALLYMLL